MKVKHLIKKLQDKNIPEQEVDFLIYTTDDMDIVCIEMEGKYSMGIMRLFAGEGESRPNGRPQIGFSTESRKFVKEGTYLTSQQAREHWEAGDCDWTQKAYKVMASIVMAQE